MSQNGQSPFRIAEPPRGVGVAAVGNHDATAPPLERIERMVASSDVFLLIKGTPQQPMCGFSANTVAIFNALGVSYATFDVLSDESIRSAAKQYAGWPTFPQVYVRGEFIGGNDIVTDMYTACELRQLVEACPS